MWNISYGHGSASQFLCVMDLRELFGGNLKRLRHQRGMSQDDLSGAAEMDRSYLSEIENGRYYVSLKVIGRLADALKVEPVEFFRPLPPTQS
jgi:transcriptional regulator with XRE-family HTH domain